MVAALGTCVRGFRAPVAGVRSRLERSSTMEEYLPSVPEEFMAQASVTSEEVSSRYERSLSDPAGFWAEEASQYHWEEPFGDVVKANFHRSKGPIFAEWFRGGKTNVCYNALDRQVAKGLGDKVCFIAERNDEGEVAPQKERYTYSEVLEEAKKVAAVLRAKGFKESDLP